MFAQNDGPTKARAIPYVWGEGLKVTSEAGVGKWYVVDLFDKFDPVTGKSTVGNADANIVVANPLAEQANVDVTAYVGDNEMSRHFSLAPGEFKTMNIGAGFLVRSGIRYVYMFIVMDVTIHIEQAEKIEVVVEDAPSNSTPFVPVDFNWTDFPAKTAGTVIPANKETWVKINFTQHSGLENGHTYKFYVEKDNATPITIQAGLSYDCPATSIQQQSAELKSVSTAKILDEAKLSMIPDSIYVRIKAPQELRLYAEQVELQTPSQTDPVLFEKKDAVEVKLYDGTSNTVYSLNHGQLVYKVGYNTLKAAPNYYRQIEVTNNGSEGITIVGKATKTFINGKAYSAVNKTVTIPAGQTYYKKIDKTMQSAVGSGEADSIWAIGPAANVTFKLTQVPEDPEFCQDAEAFVWDSWNSQSANSYKWYEIDITAAKAAKADIVLTMETVDGSEANITVDVAAACALGEPLQNYSGKSKSTTKTLTYSLYKDKPSNYIYARVRTDKTINVKAELLTTIIYNESVYGGWSNTTGPTINDAARIEDDLTIANGQTIKALGITLAGGTITIENGGKLIVGAEGVKGSENVGQITIEDGGMLWIDPACSNNNKPFITAKKKIFLGKQTTTGAELTDYHAFIALPIENREAGLGAAMRYSHWDYTTGWVSNDKFRKAFVGYNVFTNDQDASYTTTPEYLEVAFKGQLAPNKDQTLQMPGHGWHGFGNSWFDAIDVASIYNQLGSGAKNEVAVHLYVNKPQKINGVDFQDNDYVPVTSANYSYVNAEYQKVAPMQGFFLYTESAKSITLDYNSLYNANKSAAPAKRVKDDIASNVAVVLRGGNKVSNVFLVEGESSNVHKMMGNKLAIYAEDGLAQVANSNLIGTMLTIQTNEATEYTLSFAWLKGETLYLKDLVNGNVIAMTAENTYTFTAEPNTVSERFQIVGRNDAPTAIENSEFIEGANKRIENGKIVIIKNGVKYNVLGAQL